jgi:hypothetical protein
MTIHHAARFEKVCTCGWLRPRVDVFVETDHPPPNKIITVTICPVCGANHVHTMNSDEAEEVVRGTA